MRPNRTYDAYALRIEQSKMGAVRAAGGLGWAYFWCIVVTAFGMFALRF